MRWSLLLVLAACGRFGFGDAGSDATGDGVADDAPTVIAHVAVGVTSGTGAIQVAGQWCAGMCLLDVPVGTPLAIQAIPIDGQQKVSDTSTCPGGCDVLRGDATILIGFAPLITANLAFITSIGPTPPMGSLANADAFCQGRATAAGLSGTFIAMLSTSTSNLSARLAGSRGWQRRDGRTVFDLSSDVFKGQVNPITVDETGALIVPRLQIPSGTLDDGSVMAGRTCSDWALSTGPADEVRSSGFSGATYGITSGGACSSLDALNCMEVGKSVPVTPGKWPFGRYVFVTVNGFNPSLGLAGADSLCAMEATAASLPGTYRAVLADIGATAESRFASLVGPWRRPDGARVTLGGLNGPIETTINRGADGSPSQMSRVWIGASGVSTAGDATTTCNGWTTNNNSVNAGMKRSFDIGEWTAPTGSYPCNNAPVGIYCAQE